jgi:mono/diheme cytochrome c family protein
LKILKLAAIAVGVFLVAAQVFRIDKSNPPVESDVGAPPQLEEVMRRSCYDCHSNEVTWPWYADVAPMSWLVAYDVRQGRAELNFSVWGKYSPAKRLKKLHEIEQTINEGEMPSWYYIYPMHMDARLSDADRDAFTGWISSESAALEQQTPQTTKP